MPRFVLACVLLVLASPAFAAPRYYLLPLVGTGTFADTDRPKYLKEAGIGYSRVDYGAERVALVKAEVTPEQHAALILNADVVAIPANLKAAVGTAALSTVRSQLEALKIPGAWVTAATTWRDLLAAVSRIFALAQRFNGLNGLSVFAGGLSLDTTVGQLTAPQKTRLLAMASDLNLSTAGVTNGLTLRQVLKALADAMPTVGAGALQTP